MSISLTWPLALPSEIQGAHYKILSIWTSSREPNYNDIRWRQILCQCITDLLISCLALNSFCSVTMIRWVLRSFGVCRSFHIPLLHILEIGRHLAKLTLDSFNAPEDFLAPPTYARKALESPDLSSVWISHRAAVHRKFSRVGGGMGVGMLRRMLIVTSQVFPTSILLGRRNGKSLLLFLHHVSMLIPWSVRRIWLVYFLSSVNGILVLSFTEQARTHRMIKTTLYGIQPAPSNRRVNELGALRRKIIVAVTTTKRQGSSTFHLPRHRIHPALDHAGCFPGHRRF